MKQLHEIYSDIYFIPPWAPAEDTVIITEIL